MLVILRQAASGDQISLSLIAIVAAGSSAVAAIAAGLVAYTINKLKIKETEDAAAAKHRVTMAEKWQDECSEVKKEYAVVLQKYAESSIAFERLRSDFSILEERRKGESDAFKLQIDSLKQDLRMLMDERGISGTRMVQMLVKEFSDVEFDILVRFFKLEEQLHGATHTDKCLDLVIHALDGRFKTSLFDQMVAVKPSVKLKIRT